MPTVSIFFGIIIRMFFKDHRPPHFHAEHQGEKATFDFNGKIIAGNISSKTALRLIKRWAIENKKDLKENWINVELGKPLNIIKPLD